jgi:hypothetical protein
MADISIQQGEHWWDLVVQVTPTPEGAPSQITYTHPEAHVEREAGG